MFRCSVMDGMHVCVWIEKIKSHFRYWKQRQTQFFTSKFIPRIFGVSFSESFVQKMNDLSLWYIMIKLIFWYLEVKHNSLHHIIHQISYQSRHNFINHFHITDHYYIADDLQLSHSHWPSTNYTYLHIYIYIYVGWEILRILCLNLWDTSTALF